VLGVGRSGVTAFCVRLLMADVAAPAAAAGGGGDGGGVRGGAADGE